MIDVKDFSDEKEWIGGEYLLVGIEAEIHKEKLQIYEIQRGRERNPQPALPVLGATTSGLGESWLTPVSNR